MILSSGKQNPILPRKILVIGGAGYIGSVLTRKLLAKNFAVRILDNLIYGNGCSIGSYLDEPFFEFSKGDFCQLSVLRQALSGVTDVVLLAALVGDPICKKYPDLARKVNQVGSIQLFDMLGDFPIEHFVFASTCSNYGLRSSDEYADEESELNPQSLYAETKVNVEQHILSARGSTDFIPTIFRFSTAYGLSPRMRFDLTVSEFSRTLALGNDLLVYNENTWRPYCHVEDLSDAIIAVLESPKDIVNGHVFNVGSQEQNYTKKMLIDLISKYLDNPPGIRYNQGGGDPRNYRVSFEKIASVLNFSAYHHVECSVERLIHAIRDGVFDDVEQRKQFYGNYLVSYAH